MSNSALSASTFDSAGGKAITVYDVDLLFSNERDHIRCEMHDA